jgi:predicted nucleotidyltransferase
LAERTVIYDDERWRLLRDLREEAVGFIQPLSDRSINAFSYGSVARGDVSENSDVDVFVPSPPSPSILEALIEGAGFRIGLREIVQATPKYAAKGYIYLGERRSYSFPLVRLKTREREFYDFAGSAGLKQLLEGVRVPGVDKRLMLIEPNEEGHFESQINGKEGTTAKLLGIGLPTILDRSRTLSRRERVGRTGVYIKSVLSPENSFGECFERLSRSRPALRRRLRE